MIAAEETLLLVGHILADVLFVGTGEVIRWAMTLGRHRPRWNLYSRQRGGRSDMLSEPSAYLGGAFWLLAGFGVWSLVS